MVLAQGIGQQAKAVDAPAQDGAGVQSPAQTSVPGAKVTGSGGGKDEDQERERQREKADFADRCAKISGRLKAAISAKDQVAVHAIIPELLQLLVEANALGENISGIDAALESAANNVKQILSASGSTMSAYQLTKLQNDIDNDPKRGEWTQQKLDQVYGEFNRISDNYLKTQNKRINSLNKALDEIGSETGLSDETKKLLLSKDELDEEKRKRTNVHLAGAGAEASHAYHSNALNKIYDEHERVRKSGKSLAPERYEELKRREEHHLNHMKEAVGVMGKVRVHKEKWAEEANLVKEVEKKVNVIEDKKKKGFVAKLAKQHKDLSQHPLAHNPAIQIPQTEKDNSKTSNIAQTMKRNSDISKPFNGSPLANIQSLKVAAKGRKHGRE